MEVLANQYSDVKELVGRRVLGRCQSLYPPLVSFRPVGWFADVVAAYAI